MPWGVAVLMLLVVVCVIGATIVGGGLALAHFLSGQPAGSATTVILRGRTVRYRRDGLGAVIDGVALPFEIESRHGAARHGAATGDGVFDTEVALIGTSLDALRVVDAALRSRFLRIFRGCRFSSSEGTLSITPKKRPGELVSIVSDAIVLLEDLERAHLAPALPRLLARATEDPEAGVRRRALAVLLAGHPDSGESAEARRICSQDTDPDVRRLALGEIGGAVALVDDAGRGQLSQAPGAGALSLKR